MRQKKSFIKKRFIRTNDNIYEVVDEKPDFFLVKDRKTEGSTIKVLKEDVRKYGEEEYEESDKVRPMCNIFFRTYKKHTDFFGYPVVDVETSHPRMHLEEESQRTSEGKYTKYNEFDWYGAITYVDKNGKPHVNILSKMGKNGDFELLTESLE